MQIKQLLAFLMCKQSLFYVMIDYCRRKRMWSGKYKYDLLYAHKLRFWLNACVLNLLACKHNWFFFPSLNCNFVRIYFLLDLNFFYLLRNSNCLKLFSHCNFSDQIFQITVFFSFRSIFSMITRDSKIFSSKKKASNNWYMQKRNEFQCHFNIQYQLWCVFTVHVWQECRNWILLIIESF